LCPRSGPQRWVFESGGGDSQSEPRVVSIDRLLEPLNSIGLNAPGKVQRDGKRKKVVGVDHQFHLIAYRRTDRAHSRGILRRIWGAVDGHHHLNLVVSLRYKLHCRLDELLTTILQQAKGDVCGNRGAVAAEKPPYGLAEVLTLYVPERDVHRADSRGPGAGLRPRIHR
jgi:hypothetical protein